MKPLLEIKNLKAQFSRTVVDDVSFTLYPGETVALLGESGSGKSVLASAILRLTNAKLQGHILFEEEDLLLKPENQMVNVRGKKIGMVFQDPMTSLNPTLTVGKQISECVKSKEKTLFLLNQVGISEPHRRFYQYPHELSGGMRQRVMIAIAISQNPKLLIADEPTTSLDTTIQAQILDLLQRLQKEMQMTILLISHDLRIVAGIADRVFVMYGGKIVESGTIQEIYHHPAHPYTKALFKALPRLDLEKSSKLMPIPGNLPTLATQGCPFASRCDKKKALCEMKAPPFFLINKSHKTSCWQYETSD